MTFPTSWISLVIALAGIWGGVAVVMVATDDWVSSPDEVLELMSEAPWLNGEAVTVEGRSDYLDEVIVNHGRLSLEERAEMREEGELVADVFFDSLTPEEQGRFVDATVKQHFEVVMTGLNAMKEEDRKAIIGRIRRDMQKRGVDLPAAAADEDALEVMMDLGLATYYEEASAEEKRKLAPVLEEMQARIQGMRR